MAVAPIDVGWGEYGGFEGPFFRGHLPYVLPDDPTDNDMLLAAVAAAEGGHYDAVNMYDTGIVSLGLIQWINSGTHRVDDMLGFVAEICGIDAVTGPLAPALKASGASFRKDARGSWRFFTASGVVVSDDQQRALFTKGCGRKGTWTSAARAHAKTWAACLASVWANPRARKAQVDFTAPRLLNFLLPAARTVLYDDAPTTGWVTAARSAVVSYAVNRPSSAAKQLTTYRSGAPKWSADWCIGLLQHLVFGSAVGVWQSRYDSIRPVLARLHGVDLPADAAALKAWKPRPAAPAVALPTVPGEQAGDRLVRIFRTYSGCSLKRRRDELAHLVARGVDDPAAIVTVRTNCGTSALGVMALAGVRHPLLGKRYVNGQAITWLRRIGMDLKALVRYQGAKGPQPKKGALLRYNTAGKNDDHVEWLLSEVDGSGRATHGGGGRADNALSEETGSIAWNAGRPLVEWWDPDLLGIDVDAVAEGP